MPKHRYEMELTLWDQYDEETLIELRITANYTYNPGTPESGQFGPPEHYDPGSGDEVIVDDASIKIYDAGVRNGEPLELPQWLRVAIATKLEGHEERMAEQAQDD